MGHRHVRKGLDFFNLKNAKICLPLVLVEKRIIIRAQASRLSRGRNRSVDHASRGRTRTVTWLNTESDDPTPKLIYNNQYPLDPECGGLTADQVRTSKAIFGVTDEGKPGRSAIWLIGLVVLSRCASDDVFVELNFKGQ